MPVSKEVNKTHVQKDIKIRKNKGNRARSKVNSRKINSSNSNASRSKLHSKDRKSSQQRLGISSNLGKKKIGSIEEEKQRIQSFIDAFFESDANAGKFTEAEKRKFAQNFKKSFIENQFNGNSMTKKNAPPKLKALPAPPVIKKQEEREPFKAIMSAMPQMLDPKIPNEEIEESGQRLGNVKYYSNAFVNNFNFLTKNSIESDSGFDIKSNYKESEMNESDLLHTNPLIEEHPPVQSHLRQREEYFSPDSDEK